MRSHNKTRKERRRQSRLGKWPNKDGDFHQVSGASSARLQNQPLSSVFPLNRARINSQSLTSVARVRHG